MNETMTVKEALIRARNLIAVVGWTQGGWGRTLQGEIVHWSNPALACLCTSGAIMLATYNEGSDLCQAVRSAFVDANDIHDVLIPDWNDMPGRSREEVLAAFDKAIAEQP